MRERARALLAAVVALLACVGAGGLAEPARAHTVAEAARLEELLGDVPRLQRAAAGPMDESARAGASWELGRTVEQLVELLSHDAGHADAGLLSRLVVARLRALGIGIAEGRAGQRWVYDLAAFREYLARAPRGPHAADARHRLIARRFGRTVGLDPGVVAPGDLPGLEAAVAEDERFLGEFPGHAGAREVGFFLAVDLFRAATAGPDAAARERHEARARTVLGELARSAAGTAEGRAAEALLERLEATRGAKGR